MAELHPLPPGTRLVHIGPHKTGTTALQQALHRARPTLLTQGVRYAGTGSQTYRQALGLTGKRGQLGDAPPAEQDWLDLVREAQEAGDLRWVASSESFANADVEHVRRLAADLGPQVHVLRMVRRYDKLVTSQWQQSVAAGRPHTFAQYLDTLTSQPEAPFWRRHGFVPLTRTWVEGVGRDRVTVVAVDEGDRGWLLRVLEGLLGLPTGLLVPPSEDTNRSLTSAEVELVRRLNRLRVQQDWTGRVHLHFVRRGVSSALRTVRPDPRSGRIEVPAPVRRFLRERTEQDLADLLGLGVSVVGDPAWLRVPDDQPAAGDEDASSGEGATGPTLPLASAVAAVRSVVERHGTGGEFPLGGAGAALAAPVPWGRQRRLSAAERRLVAELEDQPWPAEVVDRFVHRGLVRWLRHSGAGPGRSQATAWDEPDRLDPARLAVGLTGVIAQADAAAADPAAADHAAADPA